MHIEYTSAVDREIERRINDLPKLGDTLTLCVCMIELARLERWWVLLGAFLGGWVINIVSKRIVRGYVYRETQ